MSLPASPLTQTGHLSPPFSVAVDQWFNHRAQSGRWCALVRENVERFVRYWKAAWGGRPVGGLTSLDVMAYEVHRAKSKEGKLSASCLNSERTYLHMFVRFALDQGWMEKDPTGNWVHRREVVKRTYCPLSVEEERKLLAHCPAWLRRLVIFAIQTGLRRGTIRALRWRMLREVLRKEGGPPMLVLVIPAENMKARKPHRVPLTERAISVLGQRGEPDDPIFLDMPTKSAICYHFRAAVKKAGINPATTFHDTRRTFAIRLSLAGTPMNLIMKLGAWTRPNVMLSNYCDLGDENALMALGRIG